MSVKYISVSANQHCAYFVRSDGLVDQTKGNGKISKQFAPPDGHKYVKVNADVHVTYFLTDKGALVRKGWGTPKFPKALIEAPNGLEFTDVSAGHWASFCLLSNGEMAVIRSGLEKETFSTANSPDSPGGSVKYIAASAGLDRSYLVRSDGKIEVVTNSKKKVAGKVLDTIDNSSAFTGVSDQLIIQTDKTIIGPYANYFIRADGSVERVKNPTDRTVMIPESGKYISASASNDASYLLRDDGVCCRTLKDGKISHTMNPEGGGKYIQVACGMSAAYLLRDDGDVVRSRRQGEISQVMTPPNPGEVKGGGCHLM